MEKTKKLWIICGIAIFLQWTSMILILKHDIFFVFDILFFCIGIICVLNIHKNKEDKTEE